MLLLIFAGALPEPPVTLPRNWRQETGNAAVRRRGTGAAAPRQGAGVATARRLGDPAEN